MKEGPACAEGPAHAKKMLEILTSFTARYMAKAHATYCSNFSAVDFQALFPLRVFVGANAALPQAHCQAISSAQICEFGRRPSLSLHRFALLLRPAAPFCELLPRKWSRQASLYAGNTSGSVLFGEEMDVSAGSSLGSRWEITKKTHYMQRQHC